jgi:hypothetical protein
MGTLTRAALRPAYRQGRAFRPAQCANVSALTFSKWRVGYDCRWRLASRDESLG